MAQPGDVFDWMFTVNWGGKSEPIDAPIGGFHVPADLQEQWARVDKKIIKIAEGQPINTSVFEDAEVVE
jgi:hypothetical protein